MTRKKRTYARTKTACSDCGKVGRRVGNICSDCMGKTSNALEGGRWVIDLRRRIMVWQEDEKVTPQFCGTERGYQWHRYNDPDNWPLPLDDPCGCRAAHRAHNLFKDTMRRREQAAS